MLFLKHVFLYFFLTLSFLNNSVLASLDLEEFKQDFFIEIKQITIPDYPWAFNPSIIQWKGRWLMSFRVITDDTNISPVCSAAGSKLGLVYLDDELNPLQELHFISLQHPSQTRPDILVEDARLIVCEERLHIIYSGNKDAEVTDAGFRVYVAELYDDENGFHIINNECLSIFDEADTNTREKNWVPFVYRKKLLLAYKLSPHIIFHPLLDMSERCETFSRSFPSIIWEWGEIRGGTPAVKLNDEHYLGFFHSSIHLKTIHSNHMPVQHYFIGAYIFSSQPPFKIQYISPEPIVGPNFYKGKSYEPYWHPVCAIFPCGLVIQENQIWISYGRQDHEIWIAKIDKKKLLDSLIHVSSLKYP